MMMNAQNAKENTKAFYAEQKTRAIKKAKTWTEDVFGKGISEYSRKGGKSVSYYVPNCLDIDTVVSTLESAGYDVREAHRTVYAEW